MATPSGRGVNQLAELHCPGVSHLFDKDSISELTSTKALFNLSLHSDLCGTAKAYWRLKKPAFTPINVHGGCPTTQSAKEPDV